MWRQPSSNCQLCELFTRAEEITGRFQCTPSIFFCFCVKESAKWNQQGDQRRRPILNSVKKEREQWNRHQRNVVIEHSDSSSTFRSRSSLLDRLSPLFVASQVPSDAGKKSQNHQRMIPQVHTLRTGLCEAVPWSTAVESRRADCSGCSQLVISVVKDIRKTRAEIDFRLLNRCCAMTGNQEASWDSEQKSVFNRSWVGKDKWGQRRAAINLFVESATHSTSTGYGVGNLSTYLDDTTTCGGLPMDKAACIPSSTPAKTIVFGEEDALSRREGHQSRHWKL